MVVGELCLPEQIAQSYESVCLIFRQIVAVVFAQAVDIVVVVEVEHCAHAIEVVHQPRLVVVGYCCHLSCWLYSDLSSAHQCHCFHVSGMMLQMFRNFTQNFSS